jgi:S-adenosylmethionine decarboxylase
MTSGHNSVHFTRGNHLILDLWGCDKDFLTNTSQIETTLKEAAEEAGATVLFSNMHHFGGEYGVTGVVGLAESHMSIHTYPEHGYASIDAYMCGDCDPRDTIERLKAHFKPTEMSSNVLIRGERFNAEPVEEISLFPPWMTNSINELVYQSHLLLFIVIPILLFVVLM